MNKAAEIKHLRARIVACAVAIESSRRYFSQRNPASISEKEADDKGWLCDRVANEALKCSRRLAFLRTIAGDAGWRVEL